MKHKSKWLDMMQDTLHFPSLGSGTSSSSLVVESAVATVVLQFVSGSGRPESGA